MNYCKINTPLFRMQQLQAAAMLEMQALLKAQKQRTQELKEEKNADDFSATEGGGNSNMTSQTPTGKSTDLSA